MSTTIERFQISREIAELYEERFVPRLFRPWARHVVEEAALTAGQRILDVACGTGIVARTAADRLGNGANVVGVDLNENMLAVARRVAPGIEWRAGDAANLPFDDDSFDVVFCQAALMFFPDPVKALREMGRVLRSNGKLVVQVWGSLQAQAAYRVLVEIAATHAGPDAVSMLGAYWRMGDLARLGDQFAEAGLRVSGATTHTEPANFASIDEFVRTEVESTPLVERLTADAYDAILRDARVALASFSNETGVAIPLVGHVVTACR
jgi:ubiquinone/menaquinone biosynthesis C-methylase UbiE